MTFLGVNIEATQFSLISDIIRLLIDLNSVGKGIDESDKKKVTLFDVPKLSLLSIWINELPYENTLVILYCLF